MLEEWDRYPYGNVHVKPEAYVLSQLRDED